ncbi:hypothetical protein HZC21_02695 [Candidatus Peregrinibacteria bacterium]|nr:hypothetical protein [Candidatus Peregrinibacteria bacterium]
MPPLTDLHRHFEAGISPEAIAALAQKNKVTQVLTRNGKVSIEGVDVQNPESIRAYYQRIYIGLTQPDGMTKFLDSLGLPISVIKSLEDLEGAAYHQIVEQATAGNIHTELRGSPYTYQEGLNEHASMEDVINAIRRGIVRAYGEHRASGAYIACFSRNKVDKYGQAVVDAVLRTHSSDNPVGIDIAGGPEGQFPPAMFEKLMAPVGEAGVPITVHAGEQSRWPDFEETPSSFVIDAIKKLGARRIEHGTSLITDSRAREIVKEKGVHIECCPSSSNALGYVSFERHPLKTFLDEGLSCFVNTDDPVPFLTPSVGDILDSYGKALKVAPKDIVKMTLNAINAAFVAPERRKELLGRLRMAVPDGAI